MTGDDRQSWQTYQAPAALATMPRRLRRMRPGAVYVGRGSPWATPFRAGRRVTLTARDGFTTVHMQVRPAHAVDALGLYSTWVRLGLDTVIGGRIGAPFTVADVREELAGRDLVCRCLWRETCHAEVLLEIANRTTDDR